ncbi:MAG: hypothetical protein CMK09_08585 [Ponticaulis sp.]|nr:hypothetical protein [Ponticaulis sp.]
MKKMMLAGLSAAGLVMSAGPVFAQDHNHSGHDHGAASEAPTMEECRAMHEEMMSEGVEHHDAAARQAMMENMDEQARTRMQQCHDMMQTMHGDGHHDDASAQEHGHHNADGGHRH